MTAREVLALFSILRISCLFCSHVSSCEWSVVIFAAASPLRYKHTAAQPFDDVISVLNSSIASHFPPPLPFSLALSATQSVDKTK